MYTYIYISIHFCSGHGSAGDGHLGAAAAWRGAGGGHDCAGDGSSGGRRQAASRGGPA